MFGFGLPSRSVAVPAPGLDVRSSVSAVVGPMRFEPSGQLRRIDVRIVSQSASVIGAFAAVSPSTLRGAQYPPRGLPRDRLTKLSEGECVRWNEGNDNADES